MTTSSAASGRGGKPGARVRIGRRGVLYVLAFLSVVGALGGTWLVYTAPDRRINGIVQDDPMADYVPPGATLIDELDLRSSRFTLSRRAKLTRRFKIAIHDDTRVFQAVARAARAAGWSLSETSATSATGHNPDTYAAISFGTSGPRDGRDEFEITIERQS